MSVPAARALRSPRLAIAELGSPGHDDQKDPAFLQTARTLAAAVARDGGVPYVALMDDEQSLTAWLDDVSLAYDLILIAGELGEQGALRSLILERAAGQIDLPRVEPACVLAWGVWRGGVPVMVLPADRARSMISYELFVRPMIDRMLGLPDLEWQTAVAATGWPSVPGRLQVFPVRLQKDPSGRLLLAHPTTGDEAGTAPDLDEADGFVTVDEELTEVVPGLRLAVRWLR